ncbi:MAG: hypothetical protein ACFCVH_00540 [Alphaproteobacteria bacterium]
MDIQLVLDAPGCPDERRHALTRELAATLRREASIQAALIEGEGAPGDKGDAVTLGTLLLTFISSGAAVGLFQVVRTYFERDASLEIELQRSDGARFAIRAKHVSPMQIDETIARGKAFLEGAP